MHYIIFNDPSQVNFLIFPLLLIPNFANTSSKILNSNFGSKNLFHR